MFLVHLLRGVVALGAICLVSACVTLPNLSAQDQGSDPNAATAKKTVRISQSPRGAMITSDERILFDTGKSEIKGDGQIFLDRVAGILNGKTKANVVIEGHTDNVGSGPLNLKLSQDRALAVKQAFVARGVSESRIRTDGFGMSLPVADNSTADGKQLNRRTEIIVLGDSVEKLGGTSLADKLSEGLDRFMKDSNALFENLKSMVKK